MAESQIGVAERKAKVGVGGDVVVGYGSGGVGGKPGFDAGSENEKLIGVVFNFVGLGKRGARFDDDFDLSWCDR